jgi:hypothetical protein
MMLLPKWTSFMTQKAMFFMPFIIVLACVLAARTADVRRAAAGLPLTL